MNPLKAILKYLKQQWQEDFHPWGYGYFVLLMALAFGYNFANDFEDTVLDSFYGSLEGAAYKSLFFMVAWFGVAIPLLWLKGQQAVLQQTEFWVKSLVFNLLVGVVSMIDWHMSIADALRDQFSYYFMVKVLGEFKRVLFYTLPLLLLWRHYHRQDDNIFGFSRQPFDYRPYLLMLLISAPFIFGASFQEAFMRTYPRLKPWYISQGLFFEKWQMVAIYEVLYALDFIFVEWIFRGAMVVGMARLMGRSAVLPMVAAYAFFHFGKPLGEALASILGGYLLGAIAYQTRNIAGGICIHVGIAWSMELAAWFQHLRE